MSVSNSVDPSRNDIISLPNSRLSRRLDQHPQGPRRPGGHPDPAGERRQSRRARRAPRRGRARRVQLRLSLPGQRALASPSISVIKSSVEPGDWPARSATRPTRPRPGRHAAAGAGQPRFGRPDGTALDVRAGTRGARPRPRQGPGRPGCGSTCSRRTLVVAVAAVHAVNDPELLVLGGRMASIRGCSNARRTRSPNKALFTATITASAVEGWPPCAARLCARWPKAASSC